MILRATLPISEGRISFNIPEDDVVASTWYRIVGDLSEFASSPLIALHGGPGAGHEYFSSLINLYRNQKIPIIFYDHIGCGKSTHFRDRMGDESFWRVDLFIRELDNLVDTLRLRNGFSILGQSWGGVLAGSYEAKQPLGLRKAVISSGPSSIKLYMQGVHELFERLPEDVRKALRDCGRRGDRESEEYEKAAAVWSQRHVCRLEHWPEPLKATFANLTDDTTAYLTMPSEFQVVGSLRDWEVWSNAHKIQVETLVLNGRYDEVQDMAVLPWFKNIPKVEWVTLENASHMGHWEERKRYMGVVGSFLVD
ncbi:Alpha/Beta hydrolase protein [Lophiotrema nucula]|uniref:Alpha/Beta hydrolase protein n=1 Tax=Lophiotrema nucula TaxID=690887 RepID=A0A6A5ZN36_9PLEO|nr:Alpha/Beta hydrolase protein [Lophiotrema nucula]